MFGAVFCGNMNGQRLFLEKLLLTELAFVGQLYFVFLKMIEHCVLILFGHFTMRADKLAFGILLICVGHRPGVTPGGFSTGLQFSYGRA